LERFVFYSQEELKVKSLRTLLIIIPAVMVLSALVGFFITFSSSPQAAYARIFIDLGALVALMSACMTLPKPKELRVEEVVDSIRDLARGRYDKRLSQSDFAELEPIAQAFNELAGTLSDSADPGISSLRYQYVRKVEVAPRPVVINENHSHHPELGPVQPVQLQKQAALEQESLFPVASQSPELTPSHDVAAPQEVQEAPKVSPDAPTPLPAMSDVYDLYDLFCDAHKQNQRDPIDFDTFRSTIDKARDDLMAAHQCRSIRFEVVLESGEVALRPRLVR
jgi:hypothetical protein